MIFVPLTRDQAATLAETGEIAPVRAHAVTAGLLDGHELGEAGEEADYTALAYAGVSALLDGADPLRLVLAADLPRLPAQPDRTAPDDPFGRIVLPRLAWSEVTAVFADEPASAARVSRARAMAAGRTFEDVVDDPEVEALLDACDLLWFLPEELSAVITSPDGPDGSE